MLLMSKASDCWSQERKTKKVTSQMEKFKSIIKGHFLTADDVAQGELEIIKLCRSQSFSDGSSER